MHVQYLEQSFLEQTKEWGKKIRLVQDQEALMDSQSLLAHTFYPLSAIMKHANHAESRWCNWDNRAKIGGGGGGGDRVGVGGIICRRQDSLMLVV